MSIPGSFSIPQLPTMRDTLDASLAKCLKSRAWEMAEEVVFQYRHLAQKPPEGKTVNLTCIIGWREFNVYVIGKHTAGFLRIHTKNESGDDIVVYALPEAISFNLIVSNKIDDTPPREIGFAAEMKESAKQSV